MSSYTQLTQGQRKVTHYSGLELTHIKIASSLYSIIPFLNVNSMISIDFLTLSIFFLGEGFNVINTGRNIIRI